MENYFSFGALSNERDEAEVLRPSSTSSTRAGEAPGQSSLHTIEQGLGNLIRDRYPALVLGELGRASRPLEFYAIRPAVHGQIFKRLYISELGPSTIL